MSGITSRRSLGPLKGRRLSVRFQPFEDRPNQQLSSTDQSDDEWERLQAEAHKIRLASRACDPPLNGGTFSSENIPAREALETYVTEKERSASEMTAQALELQARFVWDLSFAIKRMLVSENTGSQSELISRIGVQDIVVKLEEDPPYPQNWMEWIRGEFVSNLAAA
jgi:hypothetical protein